MKAKPAMKLFTHPGASSLSVHILLREIGANTSLHSQAFLSLVNFRAEVLQNAPQRGGSVCLSVSLSTVWMEFVLRQEPRRGRQWCFAIFE